MKLFLFLLIALCLFSLNISNVSAEEGNVENLSEAEIASMKSGEKHTFQAEVSKLMNIIINSLYSNTDVALRELLSNASDALDKIRLLALSDNSVLGDKVDLDIRLKADPENAKLHITDSGVGMTREDMVNNLGTIAKSGTKEFSEMLAKAASGDADNLIGQFGVGFYSAFLVADRVTVTSKNNADDKQWVWTSTANDDFVVYEDPEGNTLGRGTRITLHLKDEFAQKWSDAAEIKKLAVDYSEFLNFPIYVWDSHTETRTVELTEEEIEKIKEEREAEAAAAAEEESDEEEIDLEGDESEEDEDEEEEPIPTTKQVDEVVYEWDLINQVKPIWTRPKSEITDEDYNKFYRSLTKAATDPVSHIHFNAEGDVSFKCILYIPDESPKDLLSKSTMRGLKLYVKRVFITDNFDDIIPKYLSWLRGVLDSDDFTLNVSREILQQSKSLNVIKKKLIRKAVAMIQALAQDEPEKYKEFWLKYGPAIKLGITEDDANRDRLASLLRFQTSSSDGEYVSLDSYIERMKEGQEQIYYLSAASLALAEQSPLLERLTKRGFEVVYMVDNIDEYAMAHLKKYEDKKFTNIGKENLKLDGEDEKEAERETELKKEFKPLTTFLKKHLKDKVDRVTISNRLEDSPAVIVASSYGYSANFHRILKAQSMDQGAAMGGRKILELNAYHPLVQELRSLVENDEEAESTVDVAELLYETALLTSGWDLDDPSLYSGRVFRMMARGMNIDPDFDVVVPELEETDPEEADGEADQEEL